MQKRLKWLSWATQVRKNSPSLLMLQVADISAFLTYSIGVGKSSIMLRFVQDEFSATHPTTLGAAFMSKVLKKGENSYKY